MRIASAANTHRTPSGAGIGTIPGGFAGGSRPNHKHAANVQATPCPDRAPPVPGPTVVGPGGETEHRPPTGPVGCRPGTPCPAWPGSPYYDDGETSLAPAVHGVSAFLRRHDSWAQRGVPATVHTSI
jgi:hypothetical protein